MSEKKKSKKGIDRRLFLKGVGVTAAAVTTKSILQVEASGPSLLPLQEPTATPTNTIVAPTATNTAVPTMTNTPAGTATTAPTATFTPIPTNTSQPTATNTPEPAATNTPPPTSTATMEPTATLEPSATLEPTATLDPTATLEPTATLDAPPTETPLPAATETMAPTATSMPSMTPTPDVNKPDLVDLPIIVYNRIAFGLTPTSISEFNALGVDEDARLTAYVDAQLDPGSINDGACDSLIASAGFTTLSKSRTQLWQQHYRGEWQDRWIPKGDVVRSTFIRAVHSNRQLLERMVEFWHDHFNVYGDDSRIASTLSAYHRIFRENALGNFRQMLELVARDSCMLYYLDNYINSRSGPNENWARELFELMTMGAENYLGVLKQDEVPIDENSFPLGYVDDDVYEATLCFTGWTMADDERSKGSDSGDFMYIADWHDLSQKRVLSSTINLPFGQQEKDGTDVLDLLAGHPGTARYICRKLCRRFISDDPPESIVLSAAAIFHDNVNAPDQIKQVMRHILLSDEFKSTWGEKIKRPFEMTVAMLRATQTSMPFKQNHDATNNFLGWYDNSGHGLFEWSAPDGYPDEIGPWLSTTPRLQIWRFLNYTLSRKTYDEDSNILTPDEDGNFYYDLLGQTPGDIRTANEIVDFWINRVLGRPINNADRNTLVQFMSQGVNPDFDLPLDNDEDTQYRLRTLVATICFLPDFMWK